MDIIVTGSLGYDYIMDFNGRFADRIMPDAIHKISLSFLVDTLKKQFGGTAGNIAYTLKLLGENPHIVAPVGNDFDGYFRFLKKHRIDVSGIVFHKDESTSSYFGITDQDDNQIGSFYVGASKYASKLSLVPFLKKANNPFVVVSPTDPKAMVKYVKECISLNVPYFFDPAFQIAVLSPNDLKNGIASAAILIGNDYEITLIKKRLGIPHTKLLEMVPIVVTTLGGKGSLIEKRDRKWEIRPAKAKSTIDPTGAGDAYRAGFLAGYVRGFDLLTCGQMGSVAAVYTVEKYGTVTHTFTKKEFIERYQKNHGTKITLL
jgi:adenosine kinase